MPVNVRYTVIDTAYKAKDAIDFSVCDNCGKIISNIAKDPGKLPETILDGRYEHEYLNGKIKDIEKIFGCNVIVIKEKDSKEMKARQALPGKPAILVE